MNGKHPILIRVILVFAGLLCVVAAANLVLYTLGFSVGFFERWAEARYFGRIVAVQEDSFEIVGQGTAPLTVLIVSTTQIRRGRDGVGFKDIRIGFYAVIVGSENAAGQIEARVVRILNRPAPL